MESKQIQTLKQMRDTLASQLEAIDYAIQNITKKESTSYKIADTFDLSAVPDANLSGKGGIRV